MTPDEVLKMLKQVKYDLSVEQTRVTECIAAVQQLIDAGELQPLPAHVCRECGATHRGANTLAEHRYHVHDGPVPAHYLAAERMAGIALSGVEAAE